MCEQCDPNWTPFWTNEAVTTKALRAEVEKLAAEQPDRTAKCKYTYYDQSGNPLVPGCIVGQAIYNLTGKFVPTEMEGSCTENEWVYKLGGGLDLDADLQFSRKVQFYQDGGQTWGEALTRAEEDLKRSVIE